MQLLSSAHDTAIAHTQQGIPALGWSETGCVNIESIIREVLMGPYTPFLNYWQLIDSEERTVIAFGYM